MIAIDTVKRTIILANKFGLCLCIPAFLIIAYSYTSSIYPQYKVTTKIALKGISAESAISDIRSKYMVKKTLDQLPFQASYYDSDSPRKEIFGDELPVRLVFDQPRHAGGETWLRLEVTDENSFVLTHVDTTAYHEFNEPVHESYGNFKVVHNAALKNMQIAYLVKLDDPNKTLDQYYDNLRVETAGDDQSLTISIVSGNARKGADFLNKLLQAYGSDKHSISSYNHLRTAESKRSGVFSMLDRPENNVESANMNPFWVYFIALLAGTLIPVGWSVFKNQKRRILSPNGFNLPKFIGEIRRRVLDRQSRLKIAR